MAGKDAVFLAKAVDFLKQNRIELAEQELVKALDENYDNAEAIHYFGVVMLKKRQFGIAVQFISRSLALEPNNFAAWNNLGNCYKANNLEKDAEMCWKTALGMPDRTPQERSDILNNLATLHVNSGEPEKGIPYCDEAIGLVSDHPDAHWNKALLELEQGHYESGFDLYKWGFKNGIRLHRNYGPNIKDWNGEKDGPVIVWGEQGIGDELMFASILPDLIKEVPKVIFDCHPRMVKLFQRSFPGVNCYGTRKDDFIGWLDREKDAKYKIIIGDLARIYRRSLTDFPRHSGYLKADPARVEHFKKRLARLGDRPKIGISWTGGGTKTRKDYRSIDLIKWEPILKQDVDFISLQYTPEAYNTVAEVEEKVDCRIHHWPGAVQCNDYSETAALVEALDLVITVNTAIHHLSGGLGKECWTMTPHAHAWRYFSPSASKRDVPWYPTVKQFEQKTTGDWDVVINNVALKLKERL